MGDLDIQIGHAFLVVHIHIVTVQRELLYIAGTTNHKALKVEGGFQPWTIQTRHIHAGFKLVYIDLFCLQLPQTRHSLTFC